MDKNLHYILKLYTWKNIWNIQTSGQIFASTECNKIQLIYNVGLDDYELLKRFDEMNTKYEQSSSDDRSDV